MSDSVDHLATYLHLARAARLRHHLFAADRLLILAGLWAAEASLADVAHYCRHRVLQNNPNHLIGRWDRFETALADERFQSLVKQLLRRYPIEKAERMLQNLGIDPAEERQTYYSDREYAAALLGTTPERLQRLFGENGPSESQ